MITRDALAVVRLLGATIYDCPPDADDAGRAAWSTQRASQERRR
jgi:hypothetical protein